MWIIVEFPNEYIYNYRTPIVPDISASWLSDTHRGQLCQSTQPDAGRTAGPEDASRSRTVRRDDETSRKDDSKEIKIWPRHYIQPQLKLKNNEH